MTDVATIPIDTGGLFHYSEEHEVEVENRGGVGFGKIYVFHRGRGRGNDAIEAILLWSESTGVSYCNSIVPSDEATSRAVRALAETPWGARAIGVPHEVPKTPEEKREETLQAAFAKLRESLADDDPYDDAAREEAIDSFDEYATALLEAEPEDDD